MRWIVLSNPLFDANNSVVILHGLVQLADDSAIILIQIVDDNFLSVAKEKQDAFINALRAQLFLYLVDKSAVLYFECKSGSKTFLNGMLTVEPVWENLPRERTWIGE